MVSSAAAITPFPPDFELRDERLAVVRAVFREPLVLDLEAPLDDLPPDAADDFDFPLDDFDREDEPVELDLPPVPFLADVDRFDDELFEVRDEELFEDRADPPDFEAEDLDDPDLAVEELDDPDLAAVDFDDPDLEAEDLEDPDFAPDDLDDPDFEPVDFDAPDLVPDDFDDPDFELEDLDEVDLDPDDFLVVAIFFSSVIR